MDMFFADNDLAEQHADPAMKFMNPLHTHICVHHSDGKQPVAVTFVLRNIRVYFVLCKMWRILLTIPLSKSMLFK